MAAHAARMGDGSARAVPALASDAGASAPGLDSVPLPSVAGMDFSRGAGAAVPGWEAVRLLAPRAELRLLAVGRATLADAQRLGCVRLARSAHIQSQCSVKYTPLHLAGHTVMCPAPIVSQTAAASRLDRLCDAQRSVCLSLCLTPARQGFCEGRVCCTCTSRGGEQAPGGGAARVARAGGAPAAPGGPAGVRANPRAPAARLHCRALRPALRLRRRCYRHAWRTALRCALITRICFLGFGAV